MSGLRNILLAVAVLAAGSVAAGSPERSSETDPWAGRARAEVIEQLGEPLKAQKSKNGGETLVYRFRRINPVDPPQPDAEFLVVPGIGVVARIDKSRRRAADSMTVEPRSFDDQGRPVGGGATPTREASASYDTKTGQMTQTSTAQDNPPSAGKVKLRFVLDSDGRVQQWSVTGKK